MFHILFPSFHPEKGILHSNQFTPMGAYLSEILQGMEGLIEYLR